MAAPTTATEFLAIVRQSGLINETTFREYFRHDEDLPPEPSACATALVRAHLLTPFQARHLLAGKFRGLSLGPYRILNQIGQGGMGAVYLAQHTELDRQVALKMLPADKAKDKLAIERFKREARAAAALDHPNIVKVFDVFHASGLYFMVMEYVAGKDLETVIKESGALHFATAIAHVLQTAAGLQHAHEKGFVHRDIKPANLLLSKSGTIKILDMGLARSFEARDQVTEQLDQSALAGTADYVSPEQSLGMPQDQRSDIYSLGATLYTLVTGRPPYRGNTAQLLMQHQFAEPPRMSKRLKSTVPEALNDVIGRMMAKKKDDRYQSADEVIDALTPFVSGGESGVTSDTVTVRRGTTKSLPRPQDPSHPKHWSRRRWATLAGILVLTLVGVGGWILASGSSKPRGQSAQQNNGPGPAPAPSPAPSQPEPIPEKRVQMAGYDAAIGNDGMMPSF
ncbi:MAG: serine/threonine protein kinase, partial [Verrucomicrobia bacterium]|nr:serine/threonine protein kinase [Verrucomicrobiota bacterium]